MEPYTRAGPLKRGILLFWASWISIVVLMNAANAFKVAGLLPKSWAFASRNYEAIVKATSTYGTPRWLDLLLFLGVILWEMVCAILCWWALQRFQSSHRRRMRVVYLAFTALLGLFGAFILADEVFRDYRDEGDHRGIAILLIASLVAIQLLPDRERA